MRCPSCLKTDTRVLESREANEGLTIRRRRECMKCSFRFSTMEEMEILNLRVIKNDNREEAYQKEKISAGLKKALEKRPISSERFNALLARIERDIQLKSTQDKITSHEIGAIIVKHLRRTDKVAYIRFVSVYNDFQDIEAFQEALKLLKTKQKIKERE
ncbi:MAG: transcriptional regulator NrdR [Candidatus Kerfeldbacteria bacterium RIFCSPHIGHO2_02_FULL_42_14]|uniref:Transcriptional repressor NrdR n=1 Tax=Candidatus Kerfeldbacteria bacterium RIFCSPHIGHO2_02_FULL_42_14 TaxID=1798540 RepID=A0A1G2AQX3_9BACT|nr:MAG: transcriptional regulator NrdR [Candidatus Kerfeldbacteria bacterium RIFCSPHIGHO2_02_FULL_42_14]OGY81272.1 MAG: transcriptional regulator NrdR [Candidatus Kerfeldbacteria bacterium RIFCSPHIGHO2_12_FULL_42_13]OGY83547.1 MAG: transcriptional regulator NrdR [Candidatus Kerfeldbacteria bacterium RIFCSPLOWO2_02_FULL_42_19]OGY85790.1 MAG: transcriptional regulator NrdR [Candidatus Kerfeldbacteria bacterium RIFCSPLOWO2_12_FULL_43_9]